MQGFINIENGESGLSVRTKLNNIFAQIITGGEGINAIWEKLNLLMQQIEASGGGVSGLITDTSYDPSGLDPRKSIVLIALGAGTYPNLKDASGRPITITEANSFTVFFREANADYWQYTTTVINASLDGSPIGTLTSILNGPIYQITKDGKLILPATTTDAVINPSSQKTVTEEISRMNSIVRKNVAYTSLDTLNKEGGIYVLNRTTSNTPEGSYLSMSAGIIEVFADPMAHVVYQRLTANLLDPNVDYGSHNDTDVPKTWVRMYNMNSNILAPTVPIGSWGKWELTSNGSSGGGASDEELAAMLKQLNEYKTKTDARLEYLEQGRYVPINLGYDEETGEFWYEHGN